MPSGNSRLGRSLLDFGSPKLRAELRKLERRRAKRRRRQQAEARQRAPAAR